MIYSDSDYYYERNYTNMSQTTINIIIIIILITIFYFLFNFRSINYFSNLNNIPNDNVIDDLKNELAFVKEELYYKNLHEEKPKVYIEEKPKIYIEEKPKVYIEEKPKVYIEEKPKVYIEEKPKVYIEEKPKIYIEEKPKVNYKEIPKVNDIDFLYDNPESNILNQSISSGIAPIIYDSIENYDTLPIIYDPIEKYDRLKLLDPLIDPRGRSSADQIPTPQVAAQLNFPTQGILDRYHRVGLLIAINKHESKNNRRKYENFDSTDSYEDFGNIETDSYENFGNVEKIVEGKKINIDSDTNLSNYDNSSRFTRFSDNSSDLKNLSFSNNSKFNKNKIKQNNVIINIEDKENDILELIGKKIAHDWYRYFTSISKGNKIIKINVHNRNRKELYDGDVVYIPILKRHYKVKIDKLDMIEYNPYFF